MDKVLAPTIFWDLAKRKGQGHATRVTAMPAHDWLSVAAGVKTGVYLPPHHHQITDVTAGTAPPC